MNKSNIIYAGIIMLTCILCILPSCGYSDDIDSLKDRVSDLENTISSLQEACGSGKTVSSITPVSYETGDGYIIAFTDGTSITVKDLDANATSEKEGPVGLIITTDNDGNWNISYDCGNTFSPLHDSNGNQISVKKDTNGKDGVYVNVAVIEGMFELRLYNAGDPERVIDRIETNVACNPASVIQAIVEDTFNGSVTIVLTDGNSFRFNLDTAYPTGIVLLADHLEISETEGNATFEFRINPSNSIVNFIWEGEEANIQLDRISKTRAGEAESYVTSPSDYRLTNVEPSLNEEGQRKAGQYTATVSTDRKDVGGEETVALVLTTKDGRGSKVQLSSGLMTVSYGVGPKIFGIKVAGIEAEKIDGTTFYVKLPYGMDCTRLTAEFSTYANISVDGNSDPGTLDLSNPVTMTATYNGESRDYSLIAYYSNLPVIYVNTPAPIVGKDDWVKKSTIQIANAGEYDAIYEQAQLKGRGNSTWGYPKKPYAIKLDKKSEVLGMPKHKRWCLLANWMDRTDIRNEIAFEIGRRMSGLEWTPKGKFVDLVLNGKYAGNYYLCEQIKVAPNRVNVDEMTESDIAGDALTGGYLIELDTNFDEVNKFRSKILNLPVNFKDPDEDILQAAQFGYMQDYFNDVESKLISHADYSEIESLMDIDSFIDWWLLHELTGNDEPNHPKSTYMYKNRNGKLFAGPAWDFDWGTFVTTSGWRIKGAVWYPYLFRYPDFSKRVIERWQTNRPSLTTIPDYIQAISNEISESATYDCEMWPINQNVNGDERLAFPESIERMKQSYIERFNWIDKNINRLNVK